MAVARRLKWFLEHRGIAYEVLDHRHTQTSSDTAALAHVQGERLAKSVLLEDERGYVLTVLPSSRRIDLEALRGALARRLELASERELEEIFDDCSLGAVPPFGAAYGIPTAVDERMLHLSDVYFEGGDHEHLIRVTGADFAALLGAAPHGDYSSDREPDRPAEPLRGPEARQRRLDQELPHVFSLRSYGAGLRAQPEYEKDGHTGMILMKTPELRVVLEAASRETTLATHVVHGPVTLLVLEGALDIETEHGTFRVGEAEMASLPRDEKRAIRAATESLFLLALAPLRALSLEALGAEAAARRSVLIVANRTAAGGHLVEEVRDRLAHGPCQFVVLCPASPSRSARGEPRAAGEDARQRLEQTCERLRALGARVSGAIGDQNPLRAIRDLLLVEEFDEIIVSTLPQGVSEWLKLDLPSRVARRFGLPVTHVVSRS